MVHYADRLSQITKSPNPSEPCTFCKYLPNRNKVIILFWVCDIIIAGHNLCNIQDVKHILKSEFKIYDRGEIKWFLSIDFQRANYEMNQICYIEVSKPALPGQKCDDKKVGHKAS